MLKTFLQHNAVVLCKKRLQKQLIFEKWEHFKNCQKWPPSKGYRLGKIVTLGQKLKMHKNMLKTFLQHIAVVLCKKRLQKQLIFEKWEHFKNCQKWPPSKGYRLGKIVTLGQKLKMHKNMLKTFLQHNAVVLCKKRLQKQLIFEKREHFKNCQKWPPSKGYRLGKIVTLGQKLKMHKNMLKTFLQHIAVVLCKKRLQKTANIRKMRAFWKLPKMATKQKL